ncbi:MAG: dicarboxylate/amino acid:cation symporter, partial [Bacteroidetes bacterium]
LKFIAVPLVMFSIISGVASLKDISSLGKIGLKTLALYLSTTLLSVSLGLILVNILKPGNFIDSEQRLQNRIAYENWVKQTKGVEIIDNQSFSKQDATVKPATDTTPIDENLKEKIAVANQNKNQSPLHFLVDMIPENIVLSLSNNKLMLQVIFFSIFFGIALALSEFDEKITVINFITGVNEVFLKMVDIIMKAAPFFVFCLLAGVISKMADTPEKIIEIFKGLGVYSLTVVLGISMLVFVVYPLLLKIFVKRISYTDFFRKISPAQFLAFSTSSSAATLPVTIECVEENLKVPNKIAGFVLPIGATVNMDGTSLYQAVAVVFLAQMHMIDLTLGQQLTIVFTATLASIGSAAVPSAGLVMLIIVLQAVGLNPAWIAIIFPVDRILDMCRTVANVTGDATVSTIIAASENAWEE